LKVALDIHRILMLKNKIYNYLSIEIIKSFITILLTFTAIAWTVRAVSFLELMIEDGFSAYIYFKYSLLNISAILTRFVPLSFLLALVISISKFERQKELLILWTTGLNKIKIANVFFLVACLVTLFQIILAVIINPLSLNKSRALLGDTKNKQMNSVFKTNDFSDNFEGVTFYINSKNKNGEMINIFIKDKSGRLAVIASEASGSKNSTIYAKKGYIKNNKLFLFDGVIQTLNEKKELKNINFKQTDLAISNFSTRTITQPKIQETSTMELANCFLKKEKELNVLNCSFKNDKREVLETISRRTAMPLFIPLIAAIASFLLIYKKENKSNYLKKYFIFMIAFVVLIFSEISLKFTGLSIFNFYIFLLFPLVLSLICYFMLIKTMLYENKI